MCFRSDIEPKKRIAEKDIICWKFLDLAWDKVRYVSPYYSNFVWKKGKKCRSKLDKPYLGYTIYWEIEKGFHSYKSRRIAYLDRRHHIYIYDSSLHKFIIPAGASYYENDKEYVSNQLIFVK